MGTGVAGKKKRSGRPVMGAVAKSATFTTRVEPAVRRGLDEIARRRGHSVSKVAAELLSKGLAKPAGSPHNRAIACAINLLAENIERGTGKSWRRDPWTAQAFRSAVDTLLFHFTPMSDANQAVPPAIENAAAKMPPELTKSYLTPTGFSHFPAFTLIKEIEQAGSSAPVDEWDVPISLSDGAEQLAVISRELDLAQNKKGKRK
jgi:hypothetical protein